MVQSFAVLEKAQTVVFQSVTLNLAAAVCDQLEVAGFPARLGKTSHGFAVMVPAEFAVQSRGLLIGHPQKREILN
jgi:hypothetical protein